MCHVVTGPELQGVLQSAYRQSNSISSSGAGERCAIEQHATVSRLHGAAHEIFWLCLQRGFGWYDALT
jgi:hypothetical protein